MVAALELVGIRKSFDSFLALDGANFQAAPGEVHGVLGENGAGKSSLMNVACGLYRPEAGQIFVRGKEVAFAGPRDAITSRIGMVHQEFKLVRSFTVIENLLLANWRGGFAAGLRELENQIRRQADELGFELEPRRRVDELSIAERQRVEIIKVLISGADILILDEPTAVLIDHEAARLLATMRQLAAQGTTVVLVTHKLHEIKAFTDRVTVMRNGRTVAELPSRTTTADELARLTVGTALVPPRRGSTVPGPCRLVVKGLHAVRADGRATVLDASFEVRTGEIYGIAGVGGNGQTELVEALTGVRAPTAGSIALVGSGETTQASPEQLRDLGVASIPADRYAYGLAGGLPIVDNYCVGHMRHGGYGPWWHAKIAAMRAATEHGVRDYEVQGVRDVYQKAALLSGGNAQKLIIAREFSRQPKVIIAHGPSRGLDVRACAAVHARLLEARAGGAAIVLVSEDLDEILSLADRIGVMRRGRIAAEFAAPADRQAVGRVMVHHA